MTLQGVIEIDGKKQNVQGDTIRVRFSPDPASPEAKGAGGTNVTETFSMNDGVLVTSSTTTADGRTTTNTTTTNTNDGTSTTTTTTTDQGGNSSTTVEIKKK
jgi:hypothetical protein